MTVLHRVLIANRGEIAIRIAKAAASVGMDSVAVYAPVDNLSLHTRMATAARALPQDGIAAYLDGAAIIEVAKQSNCDCVHPGYGFLAENADFAAACAAEGIAFVERHSRGAWQRKSAVYCRSGARGGGRYRLSRHAEGRGRRWRARHACGGQRKRIGRGI